jgi:ketosteroid isomerase-like protein
MSVENVEVVRFHFEAFNRGDIERCVAFWRDDVELVVSEALPEPGRYLGRDAAAAWFRNYFGSFEPGYTFRLEEIFDVGGGTRHRRSGRRSGIEINNESAYVYRVEGEKIARVASYRDRRAALEVAGLRE